MLDKNKKKGYARRHTISAYDKTWEDIQKLKEQTGMTTDDIFNQFMTQRKFIKDFRNEGGLNDIEKSLISSKAIIDSDIASITEHHNNLNTDLQKQLDNIKKYLNNLE